MKKIFYSATIALFFMFLAAQGQDTLIGWTFPSGTSSDSVANLGIMPNRAYAIHLVSDSAIKFITKTYASPPACAQAQGLANGTSLEKGWYLSLITSGYDSLKLYSKQNACMTHSGPKYWKVQYKVTGGTWTDIPGANVTVGLNWTTGVLKAVKLPDACNNQQLLNLRWVMTSDSNVPGAMNGTPIVTDSSMSRIDDIYVLGRLQTGIEVSLNESLRIFPVPNKGSFRVECPADSRLLTVSNVQGEVIFQKEKPAGTVIVDLSVNTTGFLFIKVNTDRGTYTGKVVIE